MDVRDLSTFHTRRPEWLSRLVESVSACLIEHDVLAPVGCHTFYNEIDDEWEIALFVGKTEVVGGECDGMHTCSTFTLDVKQAIAAFDNVREMSWQNLPVDLDDDLGAHFAISGDVEGNAIWFRILSVPPPGYESGRLFDVNAGELKDLW